MKFKAGDRVKILPSAVQVGVEFEEIDKIGTISHIDRNVYERSGIHVKMDEVCKARGHIPQWDVGTTMIKLSLIKGQQLLFEFYNDK